MHLVFADHRDVVFRLAGHYAGVTAYAGRLIDGHSPRVAFILEAGVNAQLLRRLFGSLFCEAGIPAIFRDVGGYHDGAPLHQVMLLGGGERVFRAGLDYFQAGAEPRGIRGAKGIRVETHAVAHAAGIRSPEAELDRDGIIGLPRLYPDRSSNAAALVL